MYYRERSFDGDWLLLLFAAAVLAFAIFWQLPRGDVLASGFQHVLILDAVRDTNVMYLLLWSPTDANILFGDSVVSISAGESRVSVPVTTGPVDLCVVSENFKDCGTIYAYNP